jgi:hypothetical protein
VIVLDENLLGIRLDEPISAWYPGRICYITDLRPGMVIKDEAIPSLLHKARGATFITTNVPDFWRRVPAHPRYCIICLDLPHERFREIPQLLQRLFRLPELKTKALRMGKVVRASLGQIQYYAAGDDRIHTLGWPD